ncbi:hypothetical protein BaRGS_00015056, partial [Batillaria attramentaria]
NGISHQGPDRGVFILRSNISIGRFENVLEVNFRIQAYDQKRDDVTQTLTSAKLSDQNIVMAV